MATNPTPGCMWYWDGSNWSGPNAVGGCNACQNAGKPTVNPAEPCYVLVDCPGYGGDDKRFYILIPDTWKGKLDSYHAPKKGA